MSPDQETLHSPEIRSPEGPRIYVASLSDYNAGILHGIWTSADLPVDVLQAGIAEMLAESPTTKRYGEVAEEWAIHDYDGFGPFVRLGEYEGLERVVALARGLTTHGDGFGAWWDLERPDDSDDADLEARFEEQYLGEYSSVEEYGEQVLADLGVDIDDIPGVPEGLRPYVRIDVEAWTRDLQYGDITAVESTNGVYVFHM